MKSKPATHNQEIAFWGESVAAEFLVSLGYILTGRNIRTPFGEIDLVLQHKDQTIFVEVKARTSNAFGLPEEAVNARKLEHMLRSAAHYAADHGIEHWRLDVIAVEGRPGSNPIITHFENIGE